MEPFLPCDLPQSDHYDVRWAVMSISDKVVSLLSTLFPKQIQESKYPKLIQCCYVFDCIWLCFPHIFNQTKSLHDFFSQLKCVLSITALISKVLEHRELLLTSTCLMAECYIFFGLIGYIWSLERIIKYVFQYPKVTNLREAQVWPSLLARPHLIDDNQCLMNIKKIPIFLILFLNIKHHHCTNIVFFRAIGIYSFHFQRNMI